MSREIIEQAARFACTARPGHDHQPRLDQECAWVLAVCENLADAGLLAQPLPSRDEIAMAIAERHWDRDSGDVEVWHDLTDSEKENVAENYLTWDSAYAVIALLKGQDA